MQNLLYKLFPGNCILCGLASKRNLDLCVACENDLPRIKNSCPICGTRLNLAPNFISPCGQCLNDTPPFDSTIALFDYQPPINHLITGLKFAEKIIYADILGTLLAKKLTYHYQNNNLPELIIPVPLHKKRLQERGYNQALEISRPLAKALKISIENKTLTRVRNSPAQSTLSEKERKKNLNSAFSIRKSVTGKHVALVDDVITTGSTVTECSKLLKKNGAATIDIWAIAKTTR